LACYAFLRRELGKDFVDAGYYMVKQRRLLSASAANFPLEYVGSSVNLESLWTSVVEGCEEKFVDLSEGNACATGIDLQEAGNDANLEHLIPPPCRFCDYGFICGKKKYAT
ncbi:MAG: hypothetical protein K2Z81_13855, partial [Cyanobacteria bacterium]|nr:hypothetical protein [Cyanobacteriota bacterium]